MIEYSLCFPILSKHSVLLGLKKRGHGEGYLNGFGGKVEEGESVRECAVRELKEECNLMANEKDLRLSADIQFIHFRKPEWDCRIHAFTLHKWEGIIMHSDEMAPMEMFIDNIEFGHMRNEDRVWIPYVLQGREFSAKFRYEFEPTELTFSMINFIDRDDSYN